MKLRVTLTWIGVLGVLVLQNQAQAGWLLQKNGESKSCWMPDPREPKANLKSQIIRDIPLSISEGPNLSSRVKRYQEILFSEDQTPPSTHQRCDYGFKSDVFAQSEVRTIVSQGPVKNRINLTIVGDGYTLAEKEKFFLDAQRISNDLFGANTFKSYLPLFNVHAVFVPSRQSGISDIVHKDTALGLTRFPAGSKRAIECQNPDAADAAIRLAPATQYPILLANDDFYGGLGGKYAITTRSVKSGKIVLRHELGHNFGEVGEEYDGGQVYQGANHAEFASDLPWNHWLSEPQAQEQTQQAYFLSGEYLWQNLSSGPIQIGFDFPDQAIGGSFEVLVSAVGWEIPTDVRAQIDGQEVKLEGQFGADRTFYTLKTQSTLAPGHHSLNFTELNHDKNNILAFAMAYAYDKNYVFDHGHIAAYPTYTEPGQNSGFRPTHNDCIMRDMLSENFCVVDQENMWIKFFDQVVLIDSVQANLQLVKVMTPALTGLQFSWYKIQESGNLTEIQELRGKSEWVPQNFGLRSGKYRVKVQFLTPEVRKKDALFENTKDFSLL